MSLCFPELNSLTFFGSFSNVIWEALKDIEISFCPPLWFSDSSCRCCGQINGCWMWFKHAEHSNNGHPHNFLNLTFTPITVCVCALSHTVLWSSLYMGSLQQITGNFNSSLFPRDTTKTVCLISFASDSPNSASFSPYDCSRFLMCSLFSVSGNEQRSIIHGSSFALTSETGIRSCLDSCYWNTYYLLQRRYIFALAFSKNSSDLKSITHSLPVLVLFIIYISCFCSDITAWNFDLCSLKPSARLTSPHLTSSCSFSDSSCFPPSSHPPFSNFFLFMGLFSVSPSPRHQLSFAHFPLCHSSSLHIYRSNPLIFSLSKFLSAAAHSSV